MTKRRAPPRGKALHGAAAVCGKPGGEIVLYEAPEGTVRLEARLEQESIWLNLNQMAALFERDKSVISRHLSKVFREGELDMGSTVAFFATVQEEKGRTVTRRVAYYNLDAILSVGYRVNSKRGTQFRIWASRVLREHIVKGYTANERRLKELQKTLRLVADVAARRPLAGDEAAGLLRVVSDYGFALDLLERYDQRQLPEAPVQEVGGVALTPEEARRLIAALRERFEGSALFGREVYGGLESALGTVFQTAGGREVYPTLEEKAANLLYFLVKNHPFADGNKRIGAALFLWFLEKNRALYLESGHRRISEETLVALTLLAAESDPEDRATVVQLIVLLLAKKAPPRRSAP